MKQLFANLKLWDIPGGVWLTLFSIAALAICVHGYATGKKIPTEFVTIYGLVVGTFAASKTIQKFKE